MNLNDLSKTVTLFMHNKLNISELGQITGQNDGDLKIILNWGLCHLKSPEVEFLLVFGSF